MRRHKNKIRRSSNFFLTSVCFIPEAHKHSFDASSLLKMKVEFGCRKIVKKCQRNLRTENTMWLGVKESDLLHLQKLELRSK